MIYSIPNFDVPIILYRTIQYPFPAPPKEIRTKSDSCLTELAAPPLGHHKNPSASPLSQVLARHTQRRVSSIPLRARA